MKGVGRGVVCCRFYVFHLHGFHVSYRRPMMSTRSLCIVENSIKKVFSSLNKTFFKQNIHDGKQ